MYLYDSTNINMQSALRGYNSVGYEDSFKLQLEQQPLFNIELETVPNTLMAMDSILSTQEITIPSCSFGYAPQTSMFASFLMSMNNILNSVTNIFNKPKAGTVDQACEVKSKTKAKEKDKTNKTKEKVQNTPVGYGNYNFDVTTRYTGTAQDLNKHLQGVLAGKGDVLLRLQEKYGVNAAFLAGLVNNESGYGKSNAARNKNNVAGIMSKESNYMKLKEFDSVDDCLEALARNIKNNYVGSGRTTISQIHEKYCPIGAKNDPTKMNGGWGRTVSQLTLKYMEEVA